MTTKERTINHYLPQLNKKEKTIICGVMRIYGGFPDAHLGLVPFFSVQKVQDALTAAIAQQFLNTRPRIYAEIRSKLGHNSNKGESELLCLNPTKVYRTFGPHPERGVRIPGLGTITKTAGVAWNLGKRDYVPAKTELSLLVSLRKGPLADVKGSPCEGCWIVDYPPGYSDLVIDYIHSRCL